MPWTQGNAEHISYLVTSRHTPIVSRGLLYTPIPTASQSTEKKEGKKETKKSEHQLVPVSKVENSRGNKRAANAALEPENAPDGSERPAKRTAAALEVAKNKRKEREVEEQEWTNQISVPTL